MYSGICFLIRRYRRFLLTTGQYPTICRGRSGSQIPRSETGNSPERRIRQSRSSRNMIIRAAYQNPRLFHADLFHQFEIVLAGTDPACDFRVLIPAGYGVNYPGAVIPRSVQGIIYAIHTHAGVPHELIEQCQKYYRSPRF